MRYNYIYGLERFEIIAGYHGFQHPCFGCSELGRKMIATGRRDALYSTVSDKPKPISLTIVNYKNNGSREEIIPEFYCWPCANAKWEEIKEKLINFPISEAKTTALMRLNGEWDYHWRKSQEEKKLKPSSEIWGQKK